MPLTPEQAERFLDLLETYVDSKIQNAKPSAPDDSMGNYDSGYFAARADMLKILTGEEE